MTMCHLPQLSADFWPFFCLLIFISFIIKCQGFCLNGWTSVESMCYQCYLQTISFPNAQTYCQSIGSELASIHSSNEDQWIVQNCGSRVLIGYDSRTTSWLDNSPMDYNLGISYWTGNRESCAVTKGQSVWYEYSCSVIMAFPATAVCGYLQPDDPVTTTANPGMPSTHPTAGSTDDPTAAVRSTTAGVFQNATNAYSDAYNYSSALTQWMNEVTAFFQKNVPADERPFNVTMGVIGVVIIIVWVMFLLLLDCRALIAQFGRCYFVALFMKRRRRKNMKEGKAHKRKILIAGEWNPDKLKESSANPVRRLQVQTQKASKVQTQDSKDVIIEDFDAQNLFSSTIEPELKFDQSLPTNKLHKRLISEVCDGRSSSQNNTQSQLQSNLAERFEPDKKSKAAKSFIAPKYVIQWTDMAASQLFSKAQLSPCKGEAPIIPNTGTVLNRDGSAKPRRPITVATYLEGQRLRNPGKHMNLLGKLEHSMTRKEENARRPKFAAETTNKNEQPALLNNGLQQLGSHVIMEEAIEKGVCQGKLESASAYWERDLPLPKEPSVNTFGVDENGGNPHVPAFEKNAYCNENSRAVPDDQISHQSDAQRGVCVLDGAVVGSHISEDTLTVRSSLLSGNSLACKVTSVSDNGSPTAASIDVQDFIERTELHNAPQLDEGLIQLASSSFRVTSTCLLRKEVPPRWIILDVDIEKSTFGNQTEPSVKLHNLNLLPDGCSDHFATTNGTHVALTRTALRLPRIERLDESRPLKSSRISVQSNRKSTLHQAIAKSVENLSTQSPTTESARPSQNAQRKAFDAYIGSAFPKI